MEVKQRKSRQALLGNLLIGAGLLLLLATVGAYAYNFYEEWRARSDPWLAQLQAAYAQRAATPTEVTASLPPPSPSATSALGEVATPTPTPEPATPTPTPRVYPAPVGMSIPSINVQSRVVSVGVKDGEYVVPKFYVGHYEGSANPGQMGNGVYMGHIESISSGNVFARLPEINVGAQVTLYTSERAWIYRVVKTKIVRYDDVSVVAPTTDERISIVTCAGDWDARLRLYTERFIAIAELVDDPPAGVSSHAAGQDG